MSGDLAARIESWQPAPVESSDLLAVQRARDLANTLSLPPAQFPQDNGPLPLLWHWVYFQSWPGGEDVGDDGHPREGNFIPPLPHRRRMWAGGRLDVVRPLTIGAVARRRSSLACVRVKIGRTGELLVVTVRHELCQDDVVCLVEEQDVIYRRAATHAAAPTPAAVPGTTEPPGAVDEPVTHSWMQSLRPDPVLLFRFSALMANAHRIHYDEPYARAVEGYRGVVVHGPLLAITMAQLVRAHDVREVRSFSYRLVSPAFVNERLWVKGSLPSPGEASLAVSDQSDRPHATGRATFA